MQFSDSTGSIVSYNAVHWNGQQWELKRISFTGSCSAAQFPPVRAVWVFAQDDIWFAGAGSLVHYNGATFTNDCRMNSLLEGSINRIWGSNPNLLYTVAGEGTIIHYNDSTWQKQESNTTVRLLDVWGNSNGSSVWACGYAFNNSESILLRYDGSQWQTVWHWQFPQGASDSPYVGLLSSLWAFDADSLIIVSGDGVFRQDIRGSAPPGTENLTLGGFPARVRGTARNNIFIAGYEGMLWHYNGATWKNYPELRDLSTDFSSVAVLHDLVVLIGNDFSRGIQRFIIVRGRRAK